MPAAGRPTPRPVIAQRAAASPQPARPTAGASPTSVARQLRPAGRPANRRITRPTTANAALSAISRAASLTGDAPARRRPRRPSHRTSSGPRRTAPRRPSPIARAAGRRRRSPDRGTKSATRRYIPRSETLISAANTSANLSPGRRVARKLRNASSALPATSAPSNRAAIASSRRCPTSPICRTAWTAPQATSATKTAITASAASLGRKDPRSVPRRAVACRLDHVTLEGNVWGGGSADGDATGRRCAAGRAPPHLPRIVGSASLGTFEPRLHHLFRVDGRRLEPIQKAPATARASWCGTRCSGTCSGRRRTFWGRCSLGDRALGGARRRRHAPRAAAGRPSGGPARRPVAAGRRRAARRPGGAVDRDRHRAGARPQEPLLVGCVALGPVLLVDAVDGSSTRNGPGRPWRPRSQAGSCCGRSASSVAAPVLMPLAEKRPARLAPGEWFVVLLGGGGAGTVTPRDNPALAACKPNPEPVWESRTGKLLRCTA